MLTHMESEPRRPVLSAQLTNGGLCPRPGALPDAMEPTAAMVPL